jgi:uncharacterized protein YndB with AHSA1/START domain
MKDFDWTRFTRKVPVNAPLQRLYDAWAKPAEVQRWFLKQCDYSRADGTIGPDTLTQAGDTYAWQWFGYDPTERGRILEANGRDLFRFTFAGACIVEVKLTQHGDVVIVELTQSDIPTDEASMRNIRLGCHTGWSFFLLNLKSVYEGGLDLRNRNADLKGMMNN